MTEIVIRNKTDYHLDFLINMPRILRFRGRNSEYKLDTKEDRDIVMEIMESK